MRPYADLEPRCADNCIVRLRGYLGNQIVKCVKCYDVLRAKVRRLFQSGCGLINVDVSCLCTHWTTHRNESVDLVNTPGKLR